MKIDIKKIKKPVIIVSSISVLLLAGVLVTIFSIINKNDQKIDVSSLTEEEMINSLMQNVASAMEDGIPDPPEPTNAVKSNVNKEPVEAKTELTENVSDETFPVSLKDNELKLLSIEKYSGYFVEDGSNIETQDALAITLENTSGREIHHARIELQSNKTAQLAVFDLSFVKNGEKIFVQEKNNRKYIEGETFIISNVTAEYLKYEDGFVENITGLVSVTHEERSEGNGAVIYNKTADPINGYIYYKQKIDGMLYGGITYRITLPYAIAADTSLHIHAVHYNKNSVVAAAQLI